jgi:AbrB family looped-hinge helix DNA binding protein
VKSITKTDSVRFTTKGQVVIPLWLRKQFHIENGSRAIVVPTEDGILLKPITSALIEKGFGLLKPKAGGQRPPEEWAEHKHEEREREEANDERHSSRSARLTMQANVRKCSLCW